MVNLEKWEEIDFKDISEGDEIRVITTQGVVVNDTKGVAHHLDSWFDAWYSEDGVKFLSGPDRFHPISGGYRTIYRRKPKRDVIHTFPQNLGAVIEGIHRDTGRAKLFVWDSKDWSDGHTLFLDHEGLKRGYHSFVLLSEGV